MWLNTKSSIMATKKYKLSTTGKEPPKRTVNKTIEISLDEQKVKKCAGKPDKLTETFGAQVKPYFTNPNTTDIRVLSCTPI
mgnify:CR=1 FL=1